MRLVLLALAIGLFSWRVPKSHSSSMIVSEIELEQSRCLIEGMNIRNHSIKVFAG